MAALFIDSLGGGIYGYKKSPNHSPSLFMGLQRAPHHHHHPCLIKGHSQGGKYLTTACQHHSHCFPPVSQDTELSKQGRTPLKGGAFPGPTQHARAPQAAALLASSNTGLEAWRCSKAQGIPTTLQTTTLLQAGVEEGWPTKKKKKKPDVLRPAVECWDAKARAGEWVSPGWIK